MLSFFRSKKHLPLKTLTADIHSHLLPGLDDGVRDFQEALTIIRIFKEKGYKKLITTPHIMSDTYRNNAETISNKLEELRKVMTEERISLQVDAAAEYYLDETLIQQLHSNQTLLTFGNNYLLFETNYLSEPFQLKDFIFQLLTKGYKPILAHPERYQYLLDDFKKIEDLWHRGVLFQLNMLSLVGFYGKPTQLLAQKLIGLGWVNFLGSDFHNPIQASHLAGIQENKFYRRAIELPLLNYTL
ncbi:MAG: capsular biosynthesis protein [Flammeovirgaceae bacterium]|nr:capsular biosynthesis protein [Flammeovirgaceae bacterium]